MSHQPTEGRDFEAQTSGYEGITRETTKVDTSDETPATIQAKAQDAASLPETSNGKAPEQNRAQTITWAADLKEPANEKALRVPGPQERDNGAPLQEVDDITSDDDDVDKISLARASTSGSGLHRRGRRLSTHATTMSLERIASNMFVLGDTQEGARSKSRSRDVSTARAAGSLRQTPSSATAAEERKANIRNMSKEELGGIEYRSLWLLLKIIVGQWCILP